MTDELFPGQPLEGGVAAVPGFATGGRVDRTGLALVHEGEYIMPAQGSEAEIHALGGELQGTAVAYHFPIEVEMIGSLGADHKRQLAEYVFAELDAALRAQGG
jgi:hypothetical protein